MKRAELELMTGIDRMRRAVSAFGDCNESFLQSFSEDSLMKLWRAWALSPWNFRPEYWTVLQIREALTGIVPNWDENEMPCQGIPLDEAE